MNSHQIPSKRPLQFSEDEMSVANVGRHELSYKGYCETFPPNLFESEANLSYFDIDINGPPG